MKKIYNYYGLKNGELLGYELGRKEKYFFRIFGDGSATVEIKTETGRKYIFGNLNHCRKLYQNGYSFSNDAEKRYILTKKFRNVLTA